MSDTLDQEAGLGEHAEFNRRKMLGYVMAGTALVASVEVVRPDAAAARVPTVNPTDAYDLSDLLRDVTRPTNLLITITVNKDGTVLLDLPRSENGQGLTTSMGMIVADELGVPADNVKVTLADAKPELLYNQFTGGSVATFELYQPLRAAAALARDELLQAAAEQLQLPQTQLSILEGVVEGGNVAIPIGDLIGLVKSPNDAKKARREVKLKPHAEQKIVGTDRGRVDARAIVTGEKVFTMDLKVPGALPTMLCRPPTINGSAKRLRNMAEIKRMPGVTDVVVIPNTSAQRNGVIPGGVAVRAKTFGQCFAAIGAMKVDWADGPVKGMDNARVLKDLRKTELPMTPALPGKQLEQEFIFHFRPGDPLETNCAVADVRADRAEVWAPLKSPIWAKERLSNDLKLPLDKVTVHVTEGGGSFGRHLFSDGAFEAAAVSRAMGKPVRLMWHRADGPRQGRCHPMAISRVRIVHDDTQVLSFDQRHTGVQTDFTQGLGEILTAAASTPPGQNFLQYSQTVFNLTAMVPYDYGAVTQLLNEIYEYNTFNTSSVRNIYSPDVRTACEVLTDELAKRMGKDPFDFRQEFARHERMRNVLAVLKKQAGWGKKLPAGVAQGVGIHREYKGFAACVVEIDARAKTVNRKIKGAVTGPLVRKATFVVDVGLPINPLGLKAQMMGGIMDGIAQVLTYGLHLEDGAFLEASWDNAFYTRQWNSPRDIDVVVMPKTAEEPGGAGELGVAASMAATANALGRATGRMQTEFPVNQHTLGFKPYPQVPPIPTSPKNGLKYRNAPKQRH